jgi:hypothetical protein
VPHFADRLCSLVESRLPLTVESDRSQDDWNVVGPAIIAAATRHLRALESLKSTFPSKVIAYQLLRSLYEYVVTYAWVAADPDGRSRQWLKYDFNYRLKMDDDFRELGEALLADDTREWIDAQLPDVVPMTDVLSRARKADEAWGETLAQLDGYLSEDLRSFHRLYPLIYRNGSQFTHPSSHVVETFVTRDGNEIVIGEERETDRDPVITGTGVLAAGLAVCVTASPALAVSLDDIRQALS